MGNCAGSEVSPAEYQASKNIEKLMKQQYEQDKAIVKILLLGTGNSGKSTILKQFQIIHTEKGLGDRTKHRDTISQNVIQGICQVAQGAKDIEAVDFDLLPETHATIEAFKDLSINNIWEELQLDPDKPAEMVSELCIKAWNDPALKKAMKNEGQLHMLEVPIEYLMKNIERIKKIDYVPTVDDVLYARVRTTGIVTTEFMMDNIECRMLDVGGQRNERRKWISHFDDVTAIMFLVSLAEYDKRLVEDNATNRMVDALQCFEDIVLCPSFRTTNIILFLNKKDLFEEKIKKVPLNVCFKEYEGENEYEPAVEFISNKFMEIFRNAKDLQKVDVISCDVYVFQTMATNTQNVRTVFQLCKHIISKYNLASTGML